MLSSNSSSSNHNSNYKPFYENDITSFTSEEDPNFFFPFPNSPHTHFEYDVVNLHHLFDPDFDFITTATNMVAADPVAEEHPQPQHQPQPPPPQQQPPAASAARRRNSKKDRHSKIDTARGPRDRRMRLSLEIARKFFDLQDLLGYDKASRTVDWLLRNSASAINELRNSNSSSVVIGESCTSEECGEAASSTVAAAAKERRGRKGKRGGPGGVEQKRAAVHVGRESRRKARDRARERTSQKRRLMNERESTVGSGKGSCTTNHNYEVEDLSSDEARMSTTAAAIICPWNTTSLPFHHHASSTPAFLHQGEQITEFQFDGKPWEAYNSFNLSG